MKGETSDPLERLLASARRSLTPTRSQTDRAWHELMSRMQAPAVEKLAARVKAMESGKARLRMGDRKDLLMLLLYVRGRMDRVAEGICGTTRILKLLFIAANELNLAGLVRVPYRFVPYKYGPFAPDLYSDIEVLIRCGLVKRQQLDENGEAVIQQGESLDEGLGYNGRTTLYRLTRKGQTFAEALLRDATRKKPGLESGLVVVKAQFGSMLLMDLLRYIYTRYPEYTTESLVLRKVLGLDRPQEPTD